MKKILSVLLTCVMCSTLVFTACEAAPEESTGTDTQAPIEEMIVGRWMTSLVNGEPALTNDRLVFNVVSPSEVYTSVSLMNVSTLPWHEPELTEFAISEDGFSFTDYRQEGMSVVREYTLTDINETEFTANRTVTRFVDGVEVETLERENVVTFVRIDDDYSGDIIGTWEGSCTSEGSVFDDGQPHRWEFRDDGTFVYYNQDGDNWVLDEYADGEYFVDGILLCSRWFEGEEDCREWWEITIDGDTMTWTALRANDDGTTFTATFEMTRVAE